MGAGRPVAVAEIERRLRSEYGGAVAALARSFGDLDVLRLLGGLSTPEMARAFLVPEPTMAQRIVRAKAKIRSVGSRTGSRLRLSCQTGCVPS